jgi:hypothetical protein
MLQRHTPVLVPQVRTPVRRAGAANYVLLTVLSFGTTVVLTRLYLAATGYPQIGSGEFHIAHMLWGGLLLFIAAILPLLFSNRYALIAAALAGGSGMGLFIDEVGKFITRNNDYFHPLAAPIIYAVFLLTVLVYLRMRRPPPPRARDDLYRVFETLGEVLDRDLDRNEQAALQARLHALTEQTERPDLIPLATALLTFVSNDPLVNPPPQPSRRQRLTNRLCTWEARWIGRRLLKGILLVSLIGVAVSALIQNQIIRLAISTTQQQGFSPVLITTAEIDAAGGGGWFLIRLALVAGTGLLLFGAAGLLVLGRDRYGVLIGQWGLLLAITGVNLFVFYFDQFLTVGLVVVQYLLLMTILYYRRRFVPPGRAQTA